MVKNCGKIPPCRQKNIFSISVSVSSAWIFPRYASMRQYLDWVISFFFHMLAFFQAWVNTLTDHYLFSFICWVFSSMSHYLNWSISFLFHMLGLFEAWVNIFLWMISFEYVTYFLSSFITLNIFYDFYYWKIIIMDIIYFHCALKKCRCHKTFAMIF
jgi:hypothetical protein